MDPVGLDHSKLYRSPINSPKSPYSAGARNQMPRRGSGSTPNGGGASAAHPTGVLPARYHGVNQPLSPYYAHGSSSAAV
ncbi:hypothetical protein GGI12_006268, partial [Dipsacomyces acuminosporus]